MKKKLEDGSISVFGWLKMKEMVADILTKEKSTNKDMDNIVENNKFGVVKRSLEVGRNVVIFDGI